MNKMLILLLLTIGCISCKNATKEIDKIEIAKQYYKALDNTDDSKIASLLTDSILIIETEYDYKQTFSLKEYVEWCKWDAVFEPTYKILQIEKEGETIKAKISKIDKRILFLHEEPIVTNEVLRFADDKISSIEKIKYVVFNDTTFVKNREALLSWIDKNYPDFKKFIYDQTEAGGIQYLKAIELYKNRK